VARKHVAVITGLFHENTKYCQGLETDEEKRYLDQGFIGYENVTFRKNLHLPFSVLSTETVCSSEMSVTIYHTAQLDY
jgi:hypothetical protein